MTIRTIKSVPVFSDLTDSDLDRILKNATLRHFRKQAMIQFEDEDESKFFIIIKGRVKISRVTEDGREAIFAFLDEGDFFGEMSVFEEYESAANATAIENTDLIVLQRHDLISMLLKIPQVSINLLRELSVRLRRREAQIRSMTRQNATEKVASTLLHFADELGRLNQGHVEISRLPAHRDIASMIGTSRETISRAIKLLTRKGYLRKEGGRIIICDYQEFRSEFN